MVIATGFFDGVHFGHRFVIERLVQAARDRGDESMVVTFWPHPRNVLQDDARNLRLLTSLSEKKDILYGLGVDRIEVLPFTREFSRLTTKEYFKDYVIGRFGGKAVLLGYDNRVGSDLLTPDEIGRIAEEAGLDVIRTDSVSVPGGVVVSSTKIREALSTGNVESAAAMLGYRYTISGTVIHGLQNGRKMGFPTLKMQGSAELLFGFKHQYIANPSLTVRARNNNIFDFDEDIYGLDLKVTFLTKIREERRFESLDALKAQLEQDRKSCIVG